MEVPEWLRHDIKILGIKDVRLSCAIFELYNKYGMSKCPYEDIDERLSYLRLMNERLDYIDSNIDVVKNAITDK